MEVLAAQAATAVANEVRMAREILRNNLNDASSGLQQAGTKLHQNYGEAGSKLVSTLEQSLGVPLPIPTLVTSTGIGSVCDACALPFVHGPVIQPEIRKMQGALDACPEEAVLRDARERLRQLDHELHLVSTAPVNPLQPLTDGSLKTATGSASAAVATLLTREASHDEQRAAAEREAAERAAVAREDFLRRVEGDEQQERTSQPQ